MLMETGALAQETGLASATSANGTTRNGATLDLSQRAHDAQVTVICSAVIVTGSVAATFTPQVSFDGTTWYDLKTSNNAANVATGAGAGTTLLALPCRAEGMRYFRCNAVLAGAATAAGDLTTVTYAYHRYGEGGA